MKTLNCWGNIVILISFVVWFSTIVVGYLTWPETLTEGYPSCLGDFLHYTFVLGVTGMVLGASMNCVALLMTIIGHRNSPP